MTNVYQRLKFLFNRIPVSGFGSIPEMQQVFTSYLLILVQLRKEDPTNASIRDLIYKAHRIRKYIIAAGKARRVVDVQTNYDMASNCLGIDMEHLMGEVNSLFYMEYIPKKQQHG